MYYSEHIYMAFGLESLLLEETQESKLVSDEQNPKPQRKRNENLDENLWQ